MSFTLYGSVFWGIAFEEINQPPWQDKVGSIFDWRERLQQRLAKTSYTEEDIRGCICDFYLNFEQAMCLVAIAQSYQEGTYTHPQTITTIEVGQDWQRRLETFCTVMDIPWQQPGWYLVTQLI